MNLFERELGQVDRSDLRGWMDKVERHVQYIQEQMAYGFRQLEKRVEKLEQEKGA